MFRCWGGLGKLGLLALVLGVTPAARAQFTGAGGFSDPFSNPQASGMSSPRLSQQGEWGEILTVTSKWLVVQNQQGQQFPVSLAGIQLFVIRWPTTLDKIAPGALIDVTGLDRGTNTVMADHIDVYEGTANQLGIVPTYQPIIGFNRILTPFDLDQMNTYGYDYWRFLSPEEAMMPRRLHVVAPIINANPVSLSVGGGISVIVQPTGAAAFTITSVTPGSSSFVKKGDVVYFVPVEPTPKSLNLAELVVYKQIPLSQFAP